METGTALTQPPVTLHAFVCVRLSKQWLFPCNKKLPQPTKGCCLTVQYQKHRLRLSFFKNYYAFLNLGSGFPFKETLETLDKIKVSIVLQPYGRTRQ